MCSQSISVYCYFKKHKILAELDAATNGITSGIFPSHVCTLFRLDTRRTVSLRFLQSGWCENWGRKSKASSSSSVSVLSVGFLSGGKLHYIASTDFILLLPHPFESPVFYLSLSRRWLWSLKDVAPTALYGIFAKDFVPCYNAYWCGFSPGLWRFSVLVALRSASSLILMFEFFLTDHIDSSEEIELFVCSLLHFFDGAFFSVCHSHVHHHFPHASCSNIWELNFQIQRDWRPSRCIRSLLISAAWHGF